MYRCRYQHILASYDKQKAKRIRAIKLHEVRLVVKLGRIQSHHALLLAILCEGNLVPKGA